MSESGDIEMKRRKQHTVWMWNHIHDNIMTLFKGHPMVAKKITKYENLVATGTVTPGYAADVLLQEFMKSVDLEHLEASKQEELAQEKRKTFKKL